MIDKDVSDFMSIYDPNYLIQENTEEYVVCPICKYYFCPENEEDVCPDCG